MEVDDRPNRPKKPMLTYWVIAIIVFLLLNTFVFPNLFRRQVEQTDYSTFLQMIEEKNIGEVSVEDTQIPCRLNRFGNTNVFPNLSIFTRQEQ